jgi:hypothetical protein
MSKAISSSHFAADAAEMHLHAYNAAFYELGLRWYLGRQYLPASLAGCSTAGADPELPGEPRT